MRRARHTPIAAAIKTSTSRRVWLLHGHLHREQQVPGNREADFRHCHPRRDHPQYGSTPILATYAGSNQFPGSAGTVVQVVIGVTTATTITGSSSNPSVYGQQVTFTASVTTTSGTPTGTVRFRSGTTQLGQATLVNGVASLSTTPGQLTGGADAIVATYAATAQFAGSVSSTFYQTVTQTASAISLTSSANPSTVGQAVSFTATVSGAYVVPKGNVRFFDGTKLMATVPLTNGIAIYTTTALTSGSHTIDLLPGPMRIPDRLHRKNRWR